MGTSSSDSVKGTDGVEFGLKWGTGSVYSVVTPANRRNGRVEFQVPGFKHRPGGSVDLRVQADLIETLRIAEAKALEAPVQYFTYRLESHRGEKVDKSIPFAELAASKEAMDLLHSRLVAAYPENSPEALALIAQCAAEAAAGVIGASPQSQVREIPNEAPRGPNKSVENEPNPNQLPGESWEYAAACGMVDLAFEELTEQTEPFTPSDLDALATRFLRAADSAQLAFAGRVVRSGHSHTRARGAVRVVLKRYPMPFPTDYEGNPANPEAWDKWEALVTKAATSLLKTADRVLAKADENLRRGDGLASA